MEVPRSCLLPAFGEASSRRRLAGGGAVRSLLTDAPMSKLSLLFVDSLSTLGAARLPFSLL